MELLTYINYIIAIVFLVCYSYQFLYIAIPFVVKKKTQKEARPHKYGVLISARNEEKVIGQLIESIKNQSYPGELITIFVVADNCTDSTARVAIDAGAMVCERSDKTHVGKGYALEYLLDCIKDFYPEDEFDGFFVFDADNLLEENYIEEMNKTFSQGYKIVTSYRNSKNYGDNWISAGYGLWFLREAQYLNNSRMLIGTSCAVSGTGFLFSREVMDRTGGWRFHLLTEDIEFTVDNVVNGEKIGYCGSAVIYDEQPVKFSQSWNQRMRWAKGYLQVFKKYGRELIKGTALKGSFSCFDMTMAIMPAVVLTVLSIIINLTGAIVGVLDGQGAWAAFRSVCESIRNVYIMLLIIGGITTITEWRSIHAPAYKKVLYTFTFPIFMLTYIPISFSALFKRVEWKQISHTRGMNLDEVRRSRVSA